MVDLHPVKSETFLVPERINIDPKGFKRAVDTYTETDFGLYMARGADHPDFGYLESWLLPELNLRVSIPRQGQVRQLNVRHHTFRLLRGHCGYCRRHRQ